MFSHARNSNYCMYSDYVHDIRIRSCIASGYVIVHVRMSSARFALVERFPKSTTVHGQQFE